MSSNHQTTAGQKSAYTSAWNQSVKTYRSIILVHEVVRLHHWFISCGVTHLERLKVEELFEWVGCDVCELGHWLRLSVESRQSVPGNVVVVEIATGDDILSRAGRNEESNL
jgi:hypothetical protein